MDQKKILTQNQVIKLGLNKIPIITTDMLDGYTQIENFAFSCCINLISITIPNSVVSIGCYAFEHCTGLKSISIPNSVISIGDGAFACCVSLTSIKISNNVTNIGQFAFHGCSNLSSIKIPNSITCIENSTFSYCTSLITIEIPNSVISIGKDAFSNCNCLSFINIPNSVIYIGNNAFYNVPNIVYSGTAIGSPWGAKCINGYIEGYLVYNNESKTILKTCFPYAKGIISIPNSVTSIGDYAFSYCNNLISVKIPNSVTSIGNEVFRKCLSLSLISIPNSVTSIGIDAFYGCRNLSSIIINDKEYKTHRIIDGRCKAYKAFNADMTCRDFQYKEGETYELDGNPVLCKCGFHACLNLIDVFNYYCGKFGKDVVIHEVELDGVSNTINNYISKVVAKKITIGKRIL